MNSNDISELKSYRFTFNHEQAHKKIYSVLSSEFMIQDERRVLKRAITNYRIGKGLSLSEEGFKILKEHNTFNFSNFPFNTYINSKIQTLLDQAESPYYIDENNTIWLSDETQIMQYSLTDDLDEFLKSLETGARKN